MTLAAARSRPSGGPGVYERLRRDRLLTMEAGQMAEPVPSAIGERLKESFRRPWVGAVVVIAVIFLALVAGKGLHAVAQTGLNGLSLGAIYALGAVGLTLVYGILKL